jgi:transcriptional regulator with XRE-family HTH domain
MSREAFGDTIRRSRLRLGVTQRQLADLSTVSVRTIRDLEAARIARPRGDTVRLLAGALGIGAYDDVVAHAATGTPFDRGPNRPPPLLGPVYGRAALVTGLSDEVRTGAGRLVALTGPTGVGKTRVAIEVSGLVESPARPVIWVPDGSGVPAFPRDLPALVVLDGWRPDGASLGRLVALIREYPRVTVLATGRTATGLAGERILALPPLPVPAPGLRDFDELMRVPSMRVLVGALRRHRPGFRPDTGDVALMAELCRHTDGIPALLTGVATMVPLLGLTVVVGFARDDLPGLVGELLPALLAQVGGAVDDLGPDDRARIRSLADVAEPWTVMVAAGVVDLSPVACALFVQQMLHRGIVRPVDADDARFRVLEIVRRLIARRPAPLGPPAEFVDPGVISTTLRRRDN